MKGKDKELSDLVDEKNKLANELKVQYNVCTGPPRGIVGNGDRGKIFSGGELPNSILHAV